MIHKHPDTLGPPEGLTVSMDFFQALFSHICHELVSPLSALTTGLDLLEEKIVAEEEIFPILKESLKALRHRLDLFRSALGFNKTIPINRIYQLIQDLLGPQKKVELLWNLPRDYSTLLPVSSLLLTALIWISNRAPRGRGILSVNWVGQSIHLVLHAPTVSFSEHEQLLIETACDHPVDPQSSFTTFLTLLSQKMHYKLSVKKNPEELLLILDPWPKEPPATLRRKRIHSTESAI